MAFKDSDFGEQCRQAVSNLVRIYNSRAQQDLHPLEKSRLESELEGAKIHFQSLLQSAKRTSE